MSKLLFQTIQFSVSTDSNLKRVLFLTIQFTIQNQFHFREFYLALVRSLNVKTVLFQAFQFSISTLFSSIWLTDRALSGDNKKNALHSPKLQHYWNLTIRLFSIIYRTLVRGVGILTHLQKNSPSRLANSRWSALRHFNACWVIQCRSQSFYYELHSFKLFHTPSEYM